MKKIIVGILITTSFSSFAVNNNIGDTDCRSLTYAPPQDLSINQYSILVKTAEHAAAVQWVRGFKEGSELGRQPTESELIHFLKKVIQNCLRGRTVRAAALGAIIND